MTAVTTASRTSPPPIPAARGCWKLEAGRAVTLRPTVAGLLRIAQGRVWVTGEGPHERLTGDLFLEAGMCLPVRAGQRLVIEPFGATGPCPAAFDWVPAFARPTSRWPATLARPASDLRLAVGALGAALWGAAGALARLAGALLGLVPAGAKGAIYYIANNRHSTLESADFHSNSGVRCMN